nr:hypothetical protein CFP56_02811 [Quercus suber]
MPLTFAVELSGYFICKPRRSLAQRSQPCCSSSCSSVTAPTGQQNFGVRCSIVRSVWPLFLPELANSSGYSSQNKAYHNKSIRCFDHVEHRRSEYGYIAHSAMKAGRLIRSSHRHCRSESLAWKRSRTVRQTRYRTGNSNSGRDTTYCGSSSGDRFEGSLETF